MYKNKGQNLTEFAILLALIVIIGVIAYTLTGHQVKNLFGNSANKYKQFNPFEFSENKNNNNTAYKAGDLGGTSKKPVTKCSNSECVIDYGEFILSGIPEDFDSFIQSNGSSGGTDELASLLMQIADQLEEKGDAEGAQEYRDLANLGHFLSDGQERMENIIKNCKGTTCLSGELSFGIDQPLNIPDNIKSLLPSYTANIYNSFGNLATKFNNVATARRCKSFPTPGVVTFKPETYPSDSFVERYDNIMANSKYSSTMKDITTQLYKQVSNIGDNVFYNSRLILNPAVKKYPKYDPITGKEISTFTITQQQVNSMTLDTFLHPKSSTNTNLRGQLICVQGHNTDTGEACN